MSRLNGRVYMDCISIEDFRALRQGDMIINTTEMYES